MIHFIGEGYRLRYGLNILCNKTTALGWAIKLPLLSTVYEYNMLYRERTWNKRALIIRFLITDDGEL